MPRMREKQRLREQRFTGIISEAAPTYVPPVLEKRGYKVKFYNLSDVKVGEIGSDSMGGQIIELAFELLPLGCGAFSLVLNDHPGFTLAYRTRVDIHPYFDSSPWFTGYIETLPQPGQEKPYVYEGFGFFDQLDWILVSDSYSSVDIADVVKDIINTMVAPNTQIVYNESKIQTTNYTIDTLDFFLVTAKAAIQVLADMAGGWEFGVDDSREFYFRPVSTDVNAHFWVGKHCKDIEITELPHTVRNRLYIKAGQIQGTGSNYIGYVEDATSISTYGLHEDVITAPDVLNIDDAEAWGEEILAQTKDPDVKAQVKEVMFDTTKTKLQATGKARVTTYQGDEYTLFIKKVLYKISAAGILGEIDLE